MTWVSLHAFYHGDLDGLLLGGLRPLLAELRTEARLTGFFFLRYWDGGPHLRIRLGTNEPAHVRDLALRRLRAYLAAYPSPDRADLDRYPAQAAQLAAGEGVADYLRRPMPNNTVHEIAYRPETDRYGDGDALALVERHFVESSRIALGLIAAGATATQRIMAAAGALMLAWHGRRPPPAPPGPVDDTLRALAQRVGEIPAGTSTLPRDGALSAWWRTISTLPDARVADLCAHLLCNRLGIGIEQEHGLREAVARAIGGGA